MTVRARAFVFDGWYGYPGTVPGAGRSRAPT
jgi:hypothetical protein